MGKAFDHRPGAGNARMAQVGAVDRAGRVVVDVRMSRLLLFRGVCLTWWAYRYCYQ